MNLQEFWDEEPAQIIDPEKGYILRMYQEPPTEGDYAQVIFQTGGTYITARGMTEYPLRLRKETVDPQAQYLEVGAGMGEWMSWLQERAPSPFTHPPIVVDPADYPLMLRMLAHAESKSGKVSASLRARLRILRDRCALILDPQRVRLIPKKVSAAVNDPALRHCADIVVDWFGAGFYASDELAAYYARPDAVTLHHFVDDFFLPMLVKERGKIFSLVHCAEGGLQLPKK